MAESKDFPESSSLPIESTELIPHSGGTKWSDIHQIFYQGQNYYRIVDVIGALEVAKDPANYWSLMKSRIKSEGFSETRQGMMQFELKSPKDKRLRKQDYATRQTLLRLLPSIPSIKVEDLRIWLAEVGEQRLQQEEIECIEATLDEARSEYRRQGMDERWIEDRILNLVGRNELTDQWRKRGAIEYLHFAKLTTILHKGALGVTPNEHREIKGLSKKENPREHMDRVELALLTLTEATSTSLHIENDSQGIEELKQDTLQAAEAGEIARTATEKALRRSVVSSINFLGKPKQEKKKQVSQMKSSKNKPQKELEEPTQGQLF